MAKTLSTMLELGVSAPDFNLPEPLTGKQVNLSDFRDSELLVIFMCNHCPYVLQILDSFVDMVKGYQTQGLKVVAINSNDVTHYPDDSPQRMAELAQTMHFDFPYLFDEAQSVAKAYQAACTPDLFLFNAQHKLVYRGQYDAARPGNGEPVTGADLRAAIDNLLADKNIATEQTPSMGCNIKWKEGNEPDYFG
ncbi:MAG: thioredoxin family protein [Gammaproteobacteria bacterium]|nr:thioredoxin family protein [Gammaproteobacteria bacterium]